MRLFKPCEMFGGLCVLDGLFLLVAGAVAMGAIAAVPYAFL